MFSVFAEISEERGKRLWSLTTSRSREFTLL